MAVRYVQLEEPISAFSFFFLPLSYETPAYLEFLINHEYLLRLLMHAGMAREAISEMIAWKNKYDFFGVDDIGVSLKTPLSDTVWILYPRHN